MNLLDKFDPLSFLNIDATRLSQDEIDITRSYLNALIGEYILLKLSRNLTEEQIAQLIESKTQILNTLKSIVPDTDNAIQKELENFKKDYSNIPPIIPSSESILDPEVVQKEAFPISPDHTDHIGRAYQVVKLLKIGSPRKAMLITAGIGLAFMLACNPALKSSSSTIMPTETPVVEQLSQQEYPPKRKLIEVIVAGEEKLDTTKTIVIKSDSFHPDSLTLTKDIKEGGIYKGRYYRLPDPDLLYQRAVEIPPGLHQRLMEKIQPINNLLPPGKRVERIDFYPFVDKSEKLNINGYAGYNPPSIEIHFRPNHPLVERDLEMTVTHEASHQLERHVLSTTKDFGWGSELTAHLFNLDRRDDALRQRMKELKEKGITFERDERPFSGSLFNLVTESYYGIAGGHPYQNPAELFASTVTVMHYFPKSFIASVNKLELEEDRQAMISLARDIIDIIKNKTGDPQGTEHLFSKDLINFIYQ